MNFNLNSVEETINLGAKLGSILNPGDIICLTGDLGTGKTHFVKGIAKGIGIEENITSPTFTIVNVYPSSKFNLNHFDVYRIKSSEELENIGFDDYIFSDDVSVIEWANYVEDILPNEYIHVHIKKVNENEDKREIIITTYGKRYNYIKETLV